MQKEGDQQPAYPAVAIKERVDGLELHMGKRSLEQGPRRSRVMHEPLECGHAGLHFLRRRRHEDSCSRTSPADPVLAGAELPRVLTGASPPRKEYGVNLAYQPIGQWKTFGQASKPVLHRRHVVGDLNDVVEGYARRLFELEEQQVGQRRPNPSIWLESTASRRT